MHAHLYARLLAPLAGRCNILASDARGHGASGLPTDAREMVPWEEHAHDTAALLEAVAPGMRWWLAGHSFGATCALILASERPELVRGMALLEPPFMPFAMAADALAKGETLPNPLADQSARRRDHFADLAAARAAYAGRGVFRAFSDEDLEAYLEGGLKAEPGGVRLACAPLWEAATFRGVSLRVEPMLARLAVPFVLLAGEHGSTVPEAEYAVFAGHEQCLMAERMAGTSHFLPLERGDAVRDAILRLCEG
jgi:pimeloyl-ACP methyl ester carboxylesterase